MYANMPNHLMVVRVLKQNLKAMLEMWIKKYIFPVNKDEF